MSNSIRLHLPLEVEYAKPSKDGKVRKFILNLNNYRNAHHRILHAAKEAYHKIVVDMLKDMETPPLVGKVRVAFIYYPKTNRRVDPSNAIAIIEKFAVDACVEYGLLADDNYTIMVGSDGWDYGGVDKDNPRCEMFIYTVEEA